MFDESPKIGDKVKVTGKVKSINDDTGEVEVSYDDVSIIGKHKKHKKSYDKEDDNVDVVYETRSTEQMPPNSQTLDQALANSFPNTQ